MSDSLTYAGEFMLEKVEIISCGNDRVDVTLACQHIDIFEDIDSPILQGHIVFTDNFGLVNTLPLIGQEHLRLKIRTPSVPAGGALGEEQIIDRLFYVHNVVSDFPVKSSIAIIALDFTSTESIRNNRVIVDRTLSGTYSDIAKQVLKSDLKTKKACFIEKSSGVKKIIANELTPIEIIEQCKREAVSAEHGSATYRFFETLTGFHFRSVQSMYATESVQQYTLIENETSKDGKPGILAEYGRVRDWTRDSNADTMGGTVNGQFSSELTIHDIFNKDIITKTYNYFKQFEEADGSPKTKDNATINSYHGTAGNPMYSKMAYDQDGSTLSSAVTKKYLASTSLKDQNAGTCASMVNGDGKYVFQASNPDKWAQQRSAFNQSLRNGLVMDLTAVGHTYMRAGQIVTIDMPRQAMTKQPKKEQTDRFYHGPYLVSAIHHKFDIGAERGPTHLMFMRCVKDCIEDSLEATKALPTDIDDLFLDDEVIVDEFYSDEMA